MPVYETFLLVWVLCSVQDLVMMVWLDEVYCNFGRCINTTNNDQSVPMCNSGSLPLMMDEVFF